MLLPLLLNNLQSGAGPGRTDLSTNSAHGLPVNTYGSFAGKAGASVSVNAEPSGAAISGDAGTIVSDVEKVRLGPLGLTHNYPAVLRGPNQELISVVLSTGAGTVQVVAGTAIRQELSPTILPSKKRNFSKVDQDAIFSITGAEIRGQWATPDLASATIYPDAVQAPISSGSVESAQAFVTTAVTAGQAGTVSIDVSTAHSPTGAAISTEVATTTAIGGGGTDVAATPTTGAISGDAGTVTPTYDWSLSITGAQINAQASEVGHDSKTDVSPTIAPGSIVGQAAPPQESGPNVSVNIYSGSIAAQAGQVEQVPQMTGRGGSSSGQAGQVSVSTTSKRARARKRRRYIVEVDNQFFEVADVTAAQELLRQVREIAEAQAETDEKILPVRLRVRTGAGIDTLQSTILSELRTTRLAIDQFMQQQLDRQAIDTEISRLMIDRLERETRTTAEQDEEDTILMLLLD